MQVHFADSTARRQVEGCVFSPAGVPRAATRSLVSVWTADSVTMVIRVATTGEGQPARQVSNIMANIETPMFATVEYST